MSPIPSTYCSNPLATHTVSSIGKRSAGIDGYYTNEFDAQRVAKYLRNRGHTSVSVAKYNPAAAMAGMYPLVKLVSDTSLV